MAFVRENSTYFILLILLVIGLVATDRLASNQQIVRSGATTEVTVEFVSPKAGMKVLGTMQVQAKVQTDRDPGTFLASLRVDGADEKTIEITRADATTLMLATLWESGKKQVGEHTLEIVLLDKRTATPTVLTSATIPVTVVSP